MREGVVFNEVSVYLLREAALCDRLFGGYSLLEVYAYSKNHLPFQLVSLNPGFPENLQKRGNLNMKKLLSFKT